MSKICNRSVSLNLVDNEPSHLLYHESLILYIYAISANKIQCKNIKFMISQDFEFIVNIYMCNIFK